MNRYANKAQVVVGDKIMLDNKTGFLKDMLRVKMVGDVISTDLDGDLISVSFNINGVKDPEVRSIPYFLAQ